MTTVNIKIDATQVKRRLLALDEAVGARSIEEFLKAPVLGYLHQEEQERFASSGDAASGRWTPLAPYTEADRVRKGFPPGPPNIRSGALHDWLIGTAGEVEFTPESAILHFPDAGDTSLEAKLLVAQKGMNPNPRKGFGPIPARPVAALNERDAAGITSLLTIWIDSYLMAGG